MKRIFYILMILALFTSCKKVEKVQIQQQKVTEETISKILKTDSVTVSDFGEHRSIHQQEWEEHQKDVVDTPKIPSNE